MTDEGTDVAAADVESQPQASDVRAALSPFMRLGPLATTGRWSTVDDVAAHLSLAIDLHLLPAGKRLPPASDLATAFDVSEMTITRALRSLVESGDVVRQRGRTGGTFVSSEQSRKHRQSGTIGAAYAHVSKEVEALLDQRRVLEVGIAFEAGRRASAAGVKRLKSLVHAMDEASTWAEIRATDPMFHLELATIGGSAGAVQALSAVLGRSMSFYQPPRPGAVWRTLNGDHREIVGAIAAGDADKAARTMARHLGRMERAITRR